MTSSTENLRIFESQFGHTLVSQFILCLSHFRIMLDFLNFDD